MAIKTLTKLAILLGMTMSMQMLGLPQPVTGPAVNAMLIVSTLVVGPVGAAFVGTATPVVAFFRGILPPPLGPLIPFIVVANWAYILAFAGLQRVNKYLALLVGAVLKYLILAGAVQFIVTVPPPVAQVMQFPQLVTALVGGVVAFLVYGALRKAGWA